MDYNVLADRARAALIAAVMRRSALTYGELSRAIGYDSPAPFNQQARRILDPLTDERVRRGEPSLAVLVVNQVTGEPGAGFDPNGGSWLAEQRACFKHWSPA